MNTRKALAIIALFLACSLDVCVSDSKLRIGVKKRPEKCDMKAKKGDTLSMHYTVRQPSHFSPYHISNRLLGNARRWDRVR